MSLEKLFESGRRRETKKIATVLTMASSYNTHTTTELPSIIRLHVRMTNFLRFLQAFCVSAMTLSVVFGIFTVSVLFVLLGG